MVEKSNSYVYLFYFWAPGEGGIYVFGGRVVSNDYNFWLDRPAAELVIAAGKFHLGLKYGVRGLHVI